MPFQSDKNSAIAWKRIPGRGPRIPVESLFS
jgi:hypothetical protein